NFVLKCSFANDFPTWNFCAGTEMAQLVCGGCHTLLMYIRGATSVQCSCCHTVNLAMEGTTKIYHPPPLLQLVYSVALIPVCKILLLNRIFSCG
ncbi:Os08g0159500, partial [Oryza sativa Japonica Group]